MKRKSLLALLVVFSVFLIRPYELFANDQDIPYGARIPYRIVRGITNIGLSWTEIFLRAFGEHKTESVGESMAMGAANALIRVGVGMMDVSTFWVPDIQILDLYPDWQGWPYLFHWS